MLKGLTSFFATACLAVPCLLQAIEVSDLHLPMTRTEADSTLSKDYDFTILEDTTVRRQWHKNGRRICVDFDITTDQAICIRITYDKPVSRAEAEADVERLCGKTGSKWTKTKKKAVARVGISEKSLLKTFDNGAVLFLEGSNKKFTRITYFAKPPKTDRWQLQPMSNGGHVTAMGSTSRSGAGAADALIADERRRQSTAPTVASVPTTPKPDTPAASSSSSSGNKGGKSGSGNKGGKGNKNASGNTPKPNTPATPAKPEPATPAAPAKPARPAPVVAQAGTDDFSSGQVVETIEEIGFIEASGILDFSYFPDFADAWSESEGLEEKLALIKDRVPTSQLIAGLIIIILLLLIIWSLIAKIRNKSRARANYKKIVANGPKNGAPAAKATPAKAAPKPAPAQAPAPVPAPAKDDDTPAPPQE